MPENVGEKQWYIVTTYSMHEAKTKANLEKRIKSMNMEGQIFRVIIAEQEVPVLKDGIPTGKTKKINLYPGYVFVEMKMTDESWYIVRNTPGVTGIAGSSGGGQKPTPVPMEEIEPVLKRIGEISEEMASRFKVGDRVKIIRGPLADTEGEIISIDPETHVYRVQTVFFGRPTNIEATLSEIDKI